MAEFEIVSTTPYAWVSAERKLVQSTMVVYRDEEGRVGTIVVRKAKPSKDEVKRAVAEREKAR